jgi:hypothetical protein
LPKIGIGLALARLKEAKPKDIKEALQIAMKEMKYEFDWLEPNENRLFKYAIGGVMEYYGENSPEWNALKWEVGSLNKLSAFLEASRAGLKVEIPEVAEEDKDRVPLGLVQMWWDIKDH